MFLLLHTNSSLFDRLQHLLRQVILLLLLQGVLDEVLLVFMQKPAEEKGEDQSKNEEEKGEYYRD